MRGLDAWETAVTTPDRPPDHVSYGFPEPLGVYYMTWTDRPSFIQAALGIHNWVQVEVERWGRKRFETWDGPTLDFDTEADGTIVVTRKAPTTIGRWYWVPEPRRHPSGAPPLPATCARDELEDELGYEAAVEFIGHRAALMGYEK